VDDLKSSKQSNYSKRSTQQKLTNLKYKVIFACKTA